MKTPSYRRGRKDMHKLIEQGLSHTFLVQFTFALGFCRKDKNRSEKSSYKYCRGFNDRLDEYLESKGLERVDITKWWKIQRGESKKKTVSKKQKETKTVSKKQKETKTVSKKQKETKTFKQVKF